MIFANKKLTVKASLVLGMMSGTSLDGLDLALCRFSEEGETQFELIAGQTIPYPAPWQERLKHLMNLNGAALMEEDAALGKWMGEQAAAFLKSKQLHCELIGSHGHTVFHRPDLEFSTQIGNGAHIAVQTGIPVVCDFRSTDIALGGQGAPLVPLGDRELFGKYEVCLNIGGIANWSGEIGGERKASDIAPANMVFNFLAERLGKPYDANGEMAASGKLIPGLLKELNELSFYRVDGPKSLGREWFEESFLPLLNTYQEPTENLLRTCVEHCAQQIANSLRSIEKGTIFITGGGAYNHFLIERIKENTHLAIHIPDKAIIEFKEAIIFAFLAWRRIHHKTTALASVTGASQDSSGGAVFLP